MIRGTHLAAAMIAAWGRWKKYKDFVILRLETGSRTDIEPTHLLLLPI